MKIRDWMNVKFCTKNIYAIIILCLLLYKFGHVIGLSMGDEFGYTSVAAWLAGFNWSEQISHISYYGPGWGILLMPGMFFCNSLRHFMIYVEILNITMIICSYYIAAYILGNLFLNKNFFLIHTAAFIAIIYPSNLTQRYYAWAETINLLLYWLLLWIIFELNRKISTKNMIIFAVIECYAVMVHMRNITLVMAGVVALFYFLKKEEKFKNYNVLLYLGIVIIGIIIFFVTKRYFQEHIWMSSDSSQNNDIASVLNAYTYVAKQSGLFLRLSRSFFNKIFYLLYATVFLAPIGVWYLLVFYKKYRKVRVVIIYILCAFGFTYALTVYVAGSGGRYDFDFYARYYEYTLGMLLAFGVIALSEIRSKYLIVALIYVLLLYKVSFICASDSINIASNDETINAVCDQNIVAFIKFIVSGEVNNMIFLAMRNGIEVICIFWGLIFLAKRFSSFQHILISLIVVGIIGAYWCDIAMISTDFHIKNTSERYENIIPIVNEMDYTWHDNTPNGVYYFSSGYWNEIMLNMQAYLGNVSIHNIAELESVDLSVKNYIIISKADSAYRELMAELSAKGYDCLKENNVFALFY